VLTNDQTVPVRHKFPNRPPQRIRRGNGPGLQPPEQYAQTKAIKFVQHHFVNSVAFWWQLAILTSVEQRKALMLALVVKKAKKHNPTT
jgi:hypothetical protein